MLIKKGREQQESLGFLVADISRMMRRAFEQRLEGSSLSLAQARALVYVSRNEGIRQVELAELLEIQPITLARLIDQLETSGVVERRPDPADRRAYQLFLTPAASTHLTAIERVGTSIRTEILQGLDKHHVGILLDSLEQIRGILRSL